MLRFFAALRMTALNGHAVKCTNLVESDLALAQVLDTPPMFPVLAHSDTHSVLQDPIPIT